MAAMLDPKGLSQALKDEYGLTVTPENLMAMRKRYEGPMYLRKNKTFLYRWQDVEVWIRSTKPHLIKTG